ncbi:MAG: hypothetical protein GY820_18395 [Gammaproteobacteria bacterium]|nr:hypothetical protein [Gammaproteobacteria bacterium]
MAEIEVAAEEETVAEFAEEEGMAVGMVVTVEKGMTAEEGAAVEGEPVAGVDIAVEADEKSPYSTG